jgi:filamentous hemagglutinin family protein
MATRLVLLGSFCFRHSFVNSLIFTLSFLFLTSTTYAQVTQTIGTGDLGTQVNHVGNIYEITHGTPAGLNLFHSFGDFSLTAAETARFQTTTGSPDGTIGNILGRVTGSNPSSLFGTIDSATYYPDANLFLINPNGILFGPGAQINVGGMVHFTTADYLRLDIASGPHAGIFHADLTQPTLLTNAPIMAFGFLGSNPAAITVDGSQLILANGTGLSLVGGNISIGTDPATGTSAFISAPSGKIELVSVASPGEILYPSLQTDSNIDGETFTAKGTVSISDFSFFDVSGMTGEGNEAGGAVRIRGGQFVMDNLSVIQNMTMGDIAGGSPGISVVVDHDIRLSNLSRLEIGTAAGLGRSGNLDVKAENVEILSGSILTSSSGGPAAPGDINITATKSLTVSGLDPFGGTEPSNISTTAQSSLEGGNITIDSAGSTLSVQDDASIATSSNTGRAGNITLNSDILNVTDGGAVRTTSSNGSSGTILINASGSAIISGQSALGNISTIANSSQTSPANISITAGQFILADQARIDGDTASQQGGTVNITAAQSINLSGNSTIRSSTDTGTGTSLDLSAPSIAIDQSTLSTRISGSNPNNVGGTITASATNGDLTVSNNSLIAASTAGATEGGSVDLLASDSVIVTANSRIESTSTGTGNAGNISIDAGNQLILQNSSITTQANQASGGRISLHAVQLVQLVESTISTSVLDGAGGGGDIFIDPNLVVLQNNSQILAQAVQGAGGNITIVTPLFLADSSSFVSASSQFGLNGTVTIQSPTSNLSGSVGTLPSNPTQAQSLVTQRCAALVNGQASSFVVAGREQLPTDPGSWLSSPLYATGTGLGVKAEGVKAEGERLGTGEGLGVRREGREADTQILSLRRLTPARFLMANFADSEATGCHS